MEKYLQDFINYLVNDLNEENNDSYDFNYYISLVKEFVIKENKYISNLYVDFLIKLFDDLYYYADSDDGFTNNYITLLEKYNIEVNLTPYIVKKLKTNGIHIDI
jgi:hypothetical protein